MLLLHYIYYGDYSCMKAEKGNFFECRDIPTPLNEYLQCIISPRSSTSTAKQNSTPVCPLSTIRLFTTKELTEGQFILPHRCNYIALWWNSALKVFVLWGSVKIAFLGFPTIIICICTGFHPVGGCGTGLTKPPTPPQKRKRKERKGDREEEGWSVYFWCYDILGAEYHRLRSITPQCHKNNKKFTVRFMLLGRYSTRCVKLPRPLSLQPKISVWNPDAAVSAICYKSIIGSIH